MPLPDNFQAWEHLQDVIRKVHNKLVKEEFDDADDDDINTPRSSLKKACLIDDNDTIEITNMRMMFFYFSLRKAQDLQPFIYGIPISDYQVSNIYLPQIVCHWRESQQSAAIEKRYPIRAQCSIRFKGSYDSELEINALKSKIKNIFLNPVHSFEKGFNKYSYRDKIKGYEMIVTALNEFNAKKVINSMLEIQGDHPLNEDYLTVSTPQKNYNIQSTEKIKIGGKFYKKPSQRPKGKVIFTHAEFKVHGMPKDIILTGNLNLPLKANYS